VLDEASPRSIADRESLGWLDRLRAADGAREEAVAELRDLLLRATRFEVSRRAASLPHLRGEELDDIAQQSAHDALMAVLRKLDDFRGESRFTTWAYKFALLEAAVALRRRAWQGREITLDPDVWPLLRESGSSPQDDAETSELLGAVGAAIEQELTDHQRRVLVAITLQDVPIDVLAERMGTTRGALYKTLHDARRRLRTALAAQGMAA
jgi:RNA polymerase sigma-70 factor (ECF subfamily)